MSNKYIETPNICVNWDGKSDFLLSYVDIMSALNVYTVPKVGLVLTDEQKKLNELIVATTSFNMNIFARVYFSQYGKLTYADISNDVIDDFLTVNGYLYKDIQNLSSIALYGTTGLSLKFKYDDYVQKILDDSDNDSGVNPRFTGCTIYFTIEGPQIDGVSELHTVRMNVVNNYNNTGSDMEEREDTGEGGSDNSDRIIDIDDDTADSTEKFITADISDNNLAKYAFINSISLTDILSTESRGFEAKSKFLHVYINPLCPKAFTLTITIKVVNIDTGKYTKKKKVYTYEPTGVNITNPVAEHVYKMNNPDVSYALLRANPKLTGNVKVVIDSGGNIYLDTFKVSDIMSHRKYRHISVGSDTYYGKSLMTKFKDVPTTEFYKVPDACYSLFTPVQSYKNMYFDTYNSGVSTNDDELYSENFALLAPLCVKRILPDFFLIFKVDKTSDDYNETTMSDTEKMEYFIRNGKLIKSYDMRDGSNLGKYIRNIYDNAKPYAGDLFASYDTDNYNRFIGISLDRGVVTQAYESAYKQEEVNNQVSLNDFFTLGFERNHIVSKDIINFEFLFDDPDDELFSINTYFGIYVRLNMCADTDFSCIGFELSEESHVIKYLYDTSINAFGTDASLNSIPQYAQLIYGVSTSTGFIRLNKSLQYSRVNEEFLLKPYKNVLTARVNRADPSKCKSFITLKLNDILDVGDHIRIIIPEIKTIYEIVMSDKDSADTLSGVYMDEHGLTEVITNYYNVNAVGWTIQRIGMFIPYKKTIVNAQTEYNDETETLVYSGNSYGAEIIAQTEQLFFAFKKFNVQDTMTSWTYKENALSIVSQYEKTIFERICSPSGFVQSQQNYILSTTDEDKTIEFVGSVYPDKIILDTERDWRYFEKFYLYPLHFEFIGTRMAYAMDFIKTDDVSDSTLYSTTIDDINIFDNKSIVYLRADGSTAVSTLYDSVPVNIYKNISGVVDSSLSYVKWTTAYDNLDNTILNLRNPIISNSQISLYNVYKINAGICSILQVKDFDYNVLDANNALLDHEQDPVIGNRGEYAEKSIFNLTAGWGSESVIPEFEDTACYKYIESGKEYTLLEDLNKELQELFKDHDDFYYGEYTKVLTEYENAKAELESLEMDGADEDALLDARNNLEQRRIALDAVEVVLQSKSDKLTAHMHTIYICIPVYRKADKENNVKYDAYDVLSTYYKREIHCIYDDPYGNQNIPETYFWVWGDKQTSEKTEELTTATAYSSSPIRSTSEESIKDYIDKYYILKDSELRNAVWYGSAEEISRSNFLEFMFNKNHTKFDIALLAPYCCKWKSIGTDARGENYRLMYYDSSIDASSYYIAGPADADCSTYVGYLYTAANDQDAAVQYTNTKKYISRSFNRAVMSTSGEQPEMFGFKDFILNNNGSIDDLIYSAVMPDCRFSPVYLSGDNTIEFISSGIKFRIRSNDDNIVNFNAYAGYSGIFIVLPMANQTHKKNTELIIDELNNELILIWYNPAKTFKMGYVIDPAEYSNNSGMMLYPVNIDFTLSDLTVKHVRESYNADSGVYSSISIPDSFGIGSKEMYYDGFRMVDANTDSYEPDVTDKELTMLYRKSHNGVRLSSNLAYMYISMTQTDETSYAKIKTGGISAELNSMVPLYDNLYKTFPYYDGENISGINPIIHYGTTEDTATNSKVETLLNNTNGILNTYIITDNLIPEISADVSYNKLGSALNSISVYVKTADGVKDFTGVSNLLSVILVDPITYYKYKNIEHNINSAENRTALGRVHPTYAEPVMKNVFSFDYSTAERNNRLLDEYGEFAAADKIDSIFEKSFDGANLSIKKINSIDQMWINKYTEDSNYCMSTIDGNTHYRLAIDVLRDYSVMRDPWFFNTYRKYGLTDYSIDKTTVKKEFYTNVRGYETGYELKSFFNSKGVVLNGSDGRTLEITSWKNTKISKSEKYIRLNITDSIIYNILFRDAYMKSWKPLGNISNGSKINYIKNTILNFININNKTKFTFATDYVKTNVLSFNTDYNSGAEVITNFRNELKYENGKYYMYVYPEDTYTFYAKMTINL